MKCEQTLIQRKSARALHKFGHVIIGRMMAQFCRGTHLHQSPGIEHGNAAAHQHGFFDVVGDEHNGFVEPCLLVQHLLLQLLTN